MIKSRFGFRNTGARKESYSEDLCPVETEPGRRSTSADHPKCLLPLNAENWELIDPFNEEKICRTKFCEHL